MPHRGVTLRTAKVVTELPLFAQRAATVRHEHARVATGFAGIDALIGGGLTTGEATLMAARPDGGATALGLNLALAALLRHLPVAIVSAALSVEQLRGRLILLQARINGFRLRAGLTSDEDRTALQTAEESIPWNHLTLLSALRLKNEELLGALSHYRPALTFADMPLVSGPQPATFKERQAAARAIARIAWDAETALLLRLSLATGAHRPDRLELPGLGALGEEFAGIWLVHRQMHDTQDGENTPCGDLATVDVIRVGHRDREPATATLEYDARYGGLRDPFAPQT